MKEIGLRYDEPADREDERISLSGKVIDGS
jgi:hypothetical protein